MKSLRQIKTQKPLKKVLLISAVIIVVGLIGAAMWFFFFNKQYNSTLNGSTDGVNVINYDPPTEEEKQATEDQKDVIIKEQEGTVPSDPGLSVLISRSFQGTSGYNLRTVVDGTKSGECVATFTKSGQPTVTKTFTVVFEATSAFCKDATVPLSDFGAGGTWNLSIVVKEGNRQSSPATTSVEITK